MHAYYIFYIYSRYSSNISVVSEAKQRVSSYPDADNKSVGKAESPLKM